MAALLREHKKERQAGKFRLPAKRHQSQLLHLLRAEVKKGWWQPEVSIATAERILGDFCLLLYFGVRQPDKVRGCLDPAELSALCSLLETVYMCGVDGVIATLRSIS